MQQNLRRHFSEHAAVAALKDTVLMLKKKMKVKRVVGGRDYTNKTLKLGKYAFLEELC